MSKIPVSSKDKMIIPAHQKLLFIGDSITDAGRTRPHGEGLFGAIGTGYVQYVDALLGARYPERAIRVVNKGNGGNTVLDLKERWDEDVAQLEPDWLSVMIGINDVWRQFDVPRQTETHVSPETFETTLRELITSTRNALRGGLILMSPFMIEDNAADKMRVRMDEYGAIVKRVAADNDAILVDTQDAFNAVLQHQHSAALAWDRIHPNHIGNMVLARAFLNAIGFEW